MKNVCIIDARILLTEENRPSFQGITELCGTNVRKSIDENCRKMGARTLCLILSDFMGFKSTDQGIGQYIQTSHEKGKLIDVEFSELFGLFNRYVSEISIEGLFRLSPNNAIDIQVLFLLIFI